MRKKGEDFFQNITIQSDDICFSKEQLLSLMQSENASPEQAENSEQQDTATAWTEQKQEIVADSFSGRNSKTNIIAIYGSSHCLLPFGKNLSAEDPDGCLISRSLAEKLFGDSSAENQQIIWNDNTWTIRGTIPLSAHCLIVQTANRTMDLSYNRISIPLDNKKNRQISSENFMLQNNLSAHLLRLDYLYQWSWIQELIPSQWSDFDAWKQNWTEQIQAAELVKHTERSTLETVGLETEHHGNCFLLFGLLFCTSGMLLLWKRKRAVGK